MNLDLKRINDVLTNEENVIDKMILFRITLKLVRKEYSEVEFSNALINRRLYALREKYFFTVKELMLGDDLRDAINDHYLSLEEIAKDKKKYNDDEKEIIKYELTYLECLLDLDITFSDSALIILEELLNKKALIREK